MLKTFSVFSVLFFFGWRSFLKRDVPLELQLRTPATRVAYVASHMVASASDPTEYLPSTFFAKNHSYESTCLSQRLALSASYKDIVHDGEEPEPGNGLLWAGASSWVRVRSVCGPNLRTSASLIFTKC